MSALIKAGKMNFSVFGHGFEDTRADSGDGLPDEHDEYAIGVVGAAFDTTGQYLWLASNGYGLSQKLYKYDFETFTDVGQTIITAQTTVNLIHPTNVETNICFCSAGSDWWVFDLYDDTIYASGNSFDVGNRLSIGSAPYDCILVDDKLYIIRDVTSNVDVWLWTVDITNQSVSYVQLGYSRYATCGFIDNSSFYLFYAPTWWTDHKWIGAWKFNGDGIWGVQASEGGGDGFPYIDQAGFAVNGKLYLPTKVYSSWRLGEYNGRSTPNVEAPHPKNIMGKFSDHFGIIQYARSGTGNKAAFTTSNQGMYLTDFNDVIKLSDDTLYPLAMNDHYVVARPYTAHYIYIFEV